MRPINLDCIDLSEPIWCPRTKRPKLMEVNANAEVAGQLSQVGPVDRAKRNDVMTNPTPSTATKGKTGYFGKFVGAAVLGGLFWFTRGRKPGASTLDPHAAAFANGETDAENFDQTRSA